MKKIFTLITCLFMMVSAMAKDYENTLSMSITGMGDFESTTTVSVESDEDGYSIVLNDFSFSGMTIGDVTMSGLTATVDGDYTYFDEVTQVAPITNGGTLANAVGNQVTVTIKEGSVMSDDDLYLDLLVVVNMMGTEMEVTATFGENFAPVSYTGLMTINVKGSTTEQDATITLTNTSGNYTLTLNDFSFGSLSLGDITISDLENSATEEGVVILAYDGDITTVLGELPATLEANVSSEGVMTANITITVMGMSVTVTFDSSVTTAITNVKADEDSPVVEIYNLQGQKVTNTGSKGIYIMRKANGTTTKVYVR